MTNFKLVKWDNWVNLIIILVFGLLLFLFPVQSLNISGYLLASILMLFGISNIIKIIKNNFNITTADILTIILSVSSIALSIFLFINPTWIIRAINIALGILIIIIAIINFSYLIKYTNKTTIWWIYTSIIILLFILGITIIVNPLFLAKIIVRIEGLCLIISSIISLLLTKHTNKLLLENKK